MKIHDLFEFEKYKNVVEPNSRSRFGQTIRLTKPIKAYHATHKDVGLVLTNREIKTYDSMGTWLSSDAEMVKHMYGPNVSAYLIPAGNYLLAKRRQDFWELILNCLPLIEQFVGKEAAQHIQKYPWTGENLKFMYDLRKRARERIEQIRAEGGTPYSDSVDGMIIEMLRWKETSKLDKYRNLQKSSKYYREICLNKNYVTAYRDLLLKSNIEGIIWNKRKWDNSPQVSTIFLIFHEQDLHPI